MTRAETCRSTKQCKKYTLTNSFSCDYILFTFIKLGLQIKKKHVETTTRNTSNYSTRFSGIPSTLNTYRSGIT
jgi:hypothetical protein